MKQAGYADSTSRQQSPVLGGLRQNTKMQEALKNPGFTEEYLATGIVEGTQTTTPPSGKTRVDDDGEPITEGPPDYRARGIFYKLGAELMKA